MNNIFNNKHLFSKRMCVIAARISFVVISAFMCIQSFAQSETSHLPLPLLEDNPIWEYRYEHIPTLRDPNIKCWIDTGDRSFTYNFLGGQREIDGKNYKMLGKVTSFTSNGEDNITFNFWLPVREENGIVYTITDSLLQVCEHEYNSNTLGPDFELIEFPYLQQGKECVLYNFCTEIGETLFPADNWSTVESIVTYELMDGTTCRALKTSWGYELCEKLGYLNIDLSLGIIPILGMIVPTNGHVYVNGLNAYYQDDKMLYKAPDAREGLCVNDTCWTRDDAGEYARSYKADPRREEVFAYIQQLQKASEAAPVTFTTGQMATIILPTEQDAGKGKYYRLAGCKEGEIVFEQELQPRAHVPYIIVPHEDFSIDPAELELAGLTGDTVSVDGVRFIGTYVSEVLPSLGGDGGGFYYDIIDKTSDCSFSPSGETGMRAVVGALRAYLLVDWKTTGWNDPYTQGGTKTPWEKMPIVLRDDATPIAGCPQMVNGELSNDKRYDLQGRRISEKPSHGIYIEGGKVKARP